MPRAFSRKYRILLTRIYVVILLFLILFSESLWEKDHITSGIFFLIGVILIGIGAVGRLWCALYISGYKSNVLITTGPYSISRNPLYFFSLLGAVGVALSTETMLIPLSLLICYAVLYPSVILSEEIKLRNIHNEAFEEYCRKTPVFFPNFKLFTEPDEYVVQPKIFRKAVFEVLWFVWMLGLVEFAECLREAHFLPVLFKLY
jgi:protein-S-isoprenylcysteine O-methyltransferase Ste14